MMLKNTLLILLVFSVTSVAVANQLAYGFEDEVSADSGDQYDNYSESIDGYDHYSTEFWEGDHQASYEIQSLEQSSGTAQEQVPDWVRNNAKWWADGLISEYDFLNGIKYLVEQGIIKA